MAVLASLGNFGLANWRTLGQTSRTMKTLSGTLKYVVMAAIGLVAVLTFRALAQSTVPAPHVPPASKAAFVLIIQSERAVKDEENFEDVLKTLKSQLYCLHMKHSQGHPQGHGPHKGQMEYDLTGGSDACAQLDIKTDKVTMSETAKSASGEELTPISTHTTIQVPSMSSSDITTVLNALQ